MAHVSNDYNNTTAGGSACSYSQLGSYNAPYSMGVAAQGKNMSGTYLVPTWDAISYDALTGSPGNCSGYGSIKSAYGANAGRCQTTYSTSVCSGSKPFMPKH